VFEPQRRVGCRRTRRENEANAVLSLLRTPSQLYRSVQRILRYLARAMYSHSARARSHAARSGVHAEARRWSTSPPHHLTTSPHDGERNTRTRQRRAAMNSAPKRSSSFIIWLVMSTASYCGSKASFTSQIPRCTLRCPHGSTSLVPGSSSYRVCEFVLVTDHNSLS
jgi:hypothetical protein